MTKILLQRNVPHFDETTDKEDKTESSDSETAPNTKPKEDKTPSIPQKPSE